MLGLYIINLIIYIIPLIMTVVYIIPLIMTINPPYYDCCKSSIFLKTFNTT